MLGSIKYVVIALLLVLFACWAVSRRVRRIEYAIIAIFLATTLALILLLGFSSALL